MFNSWWPHDERADTPALRSAPLERAARLRPGLQHPRCVRSPTALRAAQDLFGQQGAQLATQGGGLARLSELLLDDVAPGAPLGDRARALLAERRSGRPVWPLCFTAVQATNSEGYFAAHFVEDRLPPHSHSYHEFLSVLHRRTSVR